MCTAEWNSTVSPVVTVVLHILFPPTEATTIITKTHMYLSHYLPSAAGYDSHATKSTQHHMSVQILMRMARQALVPLHWAK